MITEEARAFLTSPWPGLLSFICDPAGTTARPDHGESKASYRPGRIGFPGDPGWAWSIWTDGLHFERGETWPGWKHRPATVIAWPDLFRLLHSRSDQVRRIRDLAQGRGTPHGQGWRWFSCPHILTNWGWHPSYYRSEMADDYYDLGGPSGYSDRLHAWAIALDVAAQLDVEPIDLIEWAEVLATPVRHG